MKFRLFILLLICVNVTSCDNKTKVTGSSDTGYYNVSKIVDGDTFYIDDV